MFILPSKPEVCYEIPTPLSKFPSERKQRVEVNGCSLQEEQEMNCRKAEAFAMALAVFTHAPLNPTQLFWVAMSMSLVICYSGTFPQKDAWSHYHSRNTHFSSKHPHMLKNKGSSVKKIIIPCFSFASHLSSSLSELLATHLVAKALATSNPKVGNSKEPFGNSPLV